MPILPRSSYYDRQYRQTAALLRARQPYLIKNIFTGFAICTFVISIYAYTIKAVSQDDFSDVPIPETRPQPPYTPNTGVEKIPDTETIGKR